MRKLSKLSKNETYLYLGKAYVNDDEKFLKVVF